MKKSKIITVKLFKRIRPHTQDKWKTNRIVLIKNLKKEEENKKSLNTSIRPNTPDKCSIDVDDLQIMDKISTYLDISNRKRSISI